VIQGYTVGAQSQSYQSEAEEFQVREMAESIYKLQFNLAKTQIDGKWELICPRCGHIFMCDYRNDSTYCYCKLPYDLQPVYPENKLSKVALKNYKNYYHAQEIGVDFCDGLW